MRDPGHPLSTAHKGEVVRQSGHFLGLADGSLHLEYRIPSRRMGSRYDPLTKRLAA